VDDFAGKKVAIVHDWLIGGGAELVVYELHRMFPTAPIYTAVCNDYWKEKLSGTQVITSYMQHWPLKKLRKFLPVLRQHWFQNLDFTDYDLVISSSGAEAKGIRTHGKTKHINYCHAPTHYYWNRYDAYMHDPGFGPFNFLARFGLRLLIKPMRKWDYKAAQRPDIIVANSTFTAEQIKKYYGRDAAVVFPPVDVERFKPVVKPKAQKTGFVITGRQVPYKRFDLAVKACSKLSVPLTVIGNGPMHTRLRQVAGPTVTFTGRVSDKELLKIVSAAKGFIFPGLDDFGIVSIEALAAGTPVIAYKGGGALDYIEPGKNGIFFGEQSVKSLVQALKDFQTMEFNHSMVAHTAHKFSKQVFTAHMKRIINS